MRNWLAEEFKGHGKFYILQIERISQFRLRPLSSNSPKLDGKVVLKNQFGQAEHGYCSPPGTRAAIQQPEGEF
jgi:hypothetical protein